MSWWMWPICVLAGALLGLLVSRLTVPAVTNWLLTRQMNSNRPPKGTRPKVRLQIAGVTYEVSDGLIRVPDEDGKAQWVVVGPAHVRYTDDDGGQLLLGHPIPLSTAVIMRLTGPPHDRRFETAEEIRAAYHIAE